MNRRNTGYSRIVTIAAFTLALIIATLAVSELLLPETGKKTKKNNGLTIDYSHMDQGYVMVKASKSKKRLKFRVKKGDHTVTYDLNQEGKYEVIPLQYGNGKYTFSLYKNVSGKKYSEEGKITLSADMPDPLSAFLYPNQYVSYDADTACVKEAAALCAGMTDQGQIYQTICGFMKTHFTYDYIKSVSVKSGQLPDIEDAWNKRMGICQDLSAIMVAMLRSRGVPARLEIGMLNNNTYHAWVTAVVNGEEQFFDPTAALNAVNKNNTYTLERFY